MPNSLPEPTEDEGPSKRRVVFLTGPSGAGRSTALHALEDLGYETIDNMPLSMAKRLLAAPDLERSLVLGVDVRNRDFDPSALLELSAELQERADLEPFLLYLDARKEVLQRRYSETRRKHPMAPGGTVQEGIAKEASALGTLIEHASFRIDTSEMTPHQLRAEVTDLFARRETVRLAISLQSFSYKRGVPQGADLVFDCRFLRNPHWEDALRAKSGLDAEVVSYIREDQSFQPFFAQLTEMMALLLPAFRSEGKSHLTIAFGCTGGRHRSVAVTELMSEALANKGWQVSSRHREIEGRDR